MRFTTKEQMNPTYWYRWFAWRPVEIGLHRYAWMETVWRRDVEGFGSQYMTFIAGGKHCENALWTFVDFADDATMMASDHYYREAVQRRGG